MKKLLCFFFIFVAVNLLPVSADAQCSVCTRTTQQLGEKPAGKINAGILYLAVAPLAVVGIIGFRWWKKQKDADPSIAARFK